MATAEPGTLTCEGCDAEMLREVSDALLPHLAQAVVASERPLGKTPDAEVLKAELCKNLLKHDLPPIGKTKKSLGGKKKAVGIAGAEGAAPTSRSDYKIDIVGGLAKLAAAFSKSKTSMLGGLPSDTSTSKCVCKLLETNTWAQDERDSMARQLFCKHDPSRRHCCWQCFDGSEALATHAAECQFREVACPNADGGCSHTMSAYRVAEHDEDECEFKPVPCTQGCGELVRRNDMTVHCDGMCGHKPTPCPFAGFGCPGCGDAALGEGMLLQKDLVTHKAANTDPHMMLLLGAMSNMKHDTDAALDKLRAENKSLQDELKELKKSTAASDKDMAGFKATTLKGQKSLGKAQEEEAKVQKALKKSMEELNKFRVHTEKLLSSRE